MKIAQIVPRMDIGGVERGVVDLAIHLQQRGIDNIVISGGGRLIEDLKRRGITHYRLGVYKKSPLALLCVKKVRSIIDNEAVDIVHARSRVPGWISFFASRRSRAHFLTTAHGVYKSRFFSEVMAWGKFVICPSKVVARHMRDVFGVDQDKIIIINRWVDLETFSFLDYSQRQAAETIISLGRISPTKGYEYLLEAFKKVVRFNPYLKLAIVGSPDASKARYLRYLKTLVNRFALNYNVSFMGYRRDVHNVLREARMLVAPSVIEESFGRVIIEAFACGVPVVATRVGGFKEIVEEGKDGILVDAGDSQQLAEAMLKLLKDTAYARQLSTAAYEKVKHSYTLKHCLGQIEQVYEKTLATTRILVIKISSLGDVVLSLPSLAALRQHFPAAHISILTLRKYHSLLSDCPYVDDIISLENNYKHWRSLRKAAVSLRRKAFDYVIDLQNNRVSHLLALLCLPRYSFGYNLRWGFLLTKKIAYDRDLDPLSSQEKILELLGVKIHQKRLIFWKKTATASLSLPQGELIGINVSASARWQSKNWPLKHIQRLIELIVRGIPEASVVLLGDKHSCACADKIMHSAGPRVVNLCGKTTLSDLPLVIGKLKIFITPDTATLHLASALGVATIALFGPTRPQRHIVKSDKLFVMCETLPCSFCYSPKCKVGSVNACLEAITPQQVMTKIKEAFEFKPAG